MSDGGGRLGSVHYRIIQHTHNSGRRGSSLPFVPCATTAVRFSVVTENVDPVEREMESEMENLRDWMAFPTPWVRIAQCTDALTFHRRIPLLSKSMLPAAGSAWSVLCSW